MDKGLELVATLKLPANEDLYKLIDFLNRTLKDKQVVFGVAERDSQMLVSIYET